MSGANAIQYLDSNPLAELGRIGRSCRLLGESYGAIIKGQPADPLTLIKYLNEREFGQKEVLEAVSQAMGDFALLVCSDSASYVVTSTGFSGAYYAKSDDGILISRDVGPILKRLPKDRRKHDELEVVRYLVDNINLSPIRTFHKDVFRLPGGCVMTVSEEGRGCSVRSYLNDTSLEREGAKNNQPTPEEFITLVDRSARLLVEHNGKRRFVVPISGGVDGLVWLCALIKAGGRLLAVTGEKRGDTEESICAAAVAALKNKYDADLEYHAVGAEDVEPESEILLTRRKIRFLIKSNYLQDQYKLKLVDLKVQELGALDEALWLNGYGIDELYMGTKDDPNYSSVYKWTWVKSLGTLSNHFLFLDCVLRWDWWVYQVRVRLGFLSPRAAIARVLRRRAFSGKVLCKKSCWYGESEEIYHAQIDRQIEDIIDLLQPHVDECLGFCEFRSAIRTFMYYHTEAIHLIRFAAHGRAMGGTYVLPYEFGPCRDFFNRVGLGWRDALFPKKLLYDYVNDCLGARAFEALQVENVRNTFEFQWKRWKQKWSRRIKGCRKAVLCHIARQRPAPVFDRKGPGRASLVNYYDEIAISVTTGKKFSKEAAEYIDKIDTLFKEKLQREDSRILPRELENYVHLQHYLNAVERT